MSRARCSLLSWNVACLSPPLWKLSMRSTNVLSRVSPVGKHERTILRSTQRYSEALRGHQRAIRGTQKTSEGHQRAIGGHHQRSSEGHQRAIRGHHQRSSPAEKDERPSNWLTMIDRSLSTWLNAPVDCVITPSSTEPANMDSEMMSSGSAKYGQRDHDHQQEAIRGHQRDHQRGNQRLSGRPPPAK